MNIIRITVVALIVVFSTAYVAPIPPLAAAELNSMGNGGTNVTYDDASSPTTLAIAIHKQILDSDQLILLDVVGTGVLTDGDMYINMTIRVRTYDSAQLPVSDVLVHRSTIIPAFQKMRQSAALLTQSIASPELRIQPALAYTNWGTFTTYWWRNALFVARPGNGYTYVAYDHPDNYYTYHREEWNLDWQMMDSASRTDMIHIAKYEIQYALQTGVIGALLAPFVYLIGLPTYVLLGWLLAILAGINLGIWAFVYLVVQAENGDGWEYICGPGVWPYIGWWWISFGYWRDIWWPMIP